MSWYVEIVSYGDQGNTIKRLGPYYSERQAERVDRGANINLNHEKYYTTIKKDAVEPLIEKEEKE
ncbi:MAG: hypothetical protein KAR40_09565 [Candidatus Sabulitectum sp.]|nr:hypothetical protein [Candidatus Sabulitectum sp.]